MREKVRKNLVCVALAVIFVLNTVYNSGEVAFAAGKAAKGGSAQETAVPAEKSEASSENGETGQKTENTAADSAADSEKEDGAASGQKTAETGDSSGSEAKAGEEPGGDGNEDAADAKTPSGSFDPSTAGEKPSEEQTENSDGGNTTEQKPGTEGTTEQKPGTEGTIEQNPGTEGNTEQVPGTEEMAGQKPEADGTEGQKPVEPEDENPVTDQASAEDQKTEDINADQKTEDAKNADQKASSEEQKPENGQDTEKEPPVEGALAAEKELPEHTLPEVFWDEAHGDDSNTGAAEPEAVKSFEAALKRAAKGAVIYCKGVKIMDSRSYDGGQSDVTVKRCTGYTGALFQIDGGSLRLCNLAVDTEGSEKPAASIGPGGELVLEDNTRFTGAGRIQVQQGGKPVRLEAKPESGTELHIQYATDCFDKAADKSEILLVDAKGAGIDPKPYVSFENLPKDRETCLKNKNQIWMRTTARAVISEVKAVFEESGLSAAAAGLDREGIYLGGSGDDGNDGLTPGQAVRSFERARELLKKYKEEDGREFDIIINSKVIINQDSVWELDSAEFSWNPKLIRDPGYKNELILLVGYKLTLQNLTLDGNDAVQSSKAAVDVLPGGTLEIGPGAVITGNQNHGTYGGGVSLSGNLNDTKVVLNGGTISNNYARISGGGIGIYGGRADIISGTIEQNRAGRGGGIEARNGGDKTYLNVEGGTIRKNSAQAGGGIAFNGTTDSSVMGEINGGIISGNTAEEGGGIYVYASDGEVLLKGGEISGNTATSIGGGIWGGNAAAASQPRFTMDDGVIRGNKVEGGDGYGGGIYIKAMHFIMNGGTICGNSAVYGGGIAKVADSFLLSLNGGEIRDNQADHGAGISLGNVHIDTAYRINAAFGGSKISQEIALLRKAGAPVGTISLNAPLSTDSVLSLEIVNPSASDLGTKIVVPDGVNITDASPYLSGFTVSGGSGYTLRADGTGLALSMASFVNGTDGDDANDGSSPSKAYRTMEKAADRLGSAAGTIFICGTVTVSGTENWTLQNDQYITRYEGGIEAGTEYEAFTGDLVKVSDGAALEMYHILLQGASGNDALPDSGSLLVLDGSLKVSADTVFRNGSVYLKDGKKVTVDGSGTQVIMKAAKENPEPGDVIAEYDTAADTNAEQFQLDSSMEDLRLIADGTAVKLAEGPTAYVDGSGGDDANTGDAPDHAFRTLKKAYDFLKQGGGKICVVQPVTIDETITLSADQYQEGDDSVAITGGKVKIFRYRGNKNALFTVNTGSLTLSGLRVDGGGFGSRNAPLVRVEAAGTLRLENNTVFCNNKSVHAGGAVYNNGRVELFDCSFSGNEAPEGAAIYQNGDLILKGNADFGGEEIYYGAGKYITVASAILAAQKLMVNLAAGDAPAGRIIAVFEDGAYAGSVLEEAEHFTINSAATDKGLMASGEKTLVLADDFKADIQKTEFFGELGSKVTLSADIDLASPDDVQVTLKNGGQEIAAELKSEGSAKLVTFSLEEASLGSLTVVLSCRETVVTKEIKVSGYTVAYAEGQTGLLAQAQRDEESGLHRDSAVITVYNGTQIIRSFTHKEAEIRYEDGSEVRIDNENISRDMSGDEAIKCFGLDLEESQVVLPGKTAELEVTLLNGDLLTAAKTGSITIKDAAIGEAKTDIALAFTTKPVTRAAATVKKDGMALKGAEMGLQDSAGVFHWMTEKIPDPSTLYPMNIPLKGAGEGWPYRLTGLETGSYELIINGLETGQILEVQEGIVAEAEVNLYSIRYQLNEGGSREPLPDSYVQGMGAKLPEPKRDGYLFRGWYETDDFGGEKVAAIPAEAGRPYVLYAKWENKSGEPTKDPTNPEDPKEPGKSDDPTDSKKPGKDKPVNVKPSDTQNPPGPQDPQSGSIIGKIISFVKALPQTGDSNMRKIIIVDMALIGGMAYLMKLFAEQGEVGMSEEQKNDLLLKIIEGVRGKNIILRALALGLIFIVLAFYYTIGMKKEAERIKSYQNIHCK